ncbi:hypothetical protein HLBS07_27480 [Vibrio alginolyticus]|nr:hypothetical protein HLBS07_27480 [Vibrio alginolyticus]
MTGSKWQWLLKQMTRKLWVRTSLYALLAVATALMSIVLNQFITLPPCHQRQQGFVEQHIKYPRNLHACSDYILSQYYGLSIQCR